MIQLDGVMEVTELERYFSLTVRLSEVFTAYRAALTSLLSLFFVILCFNLLVCLFTTILVK